MRWLELSVEADLEAVEAVSEILGRESGGGTAVRPTRLLRNPDDELDVREDRTAPYVVTGHVAADDGEPPASVERVERALWHLQAFGLGPVGQLQVRAVDDAGWADAWREHYVPQRVGRVVIVPSWVDEPLRPGEVAVVLDPGMAFGTGLHPTTRGCLALLGELEPLPERIIDVGTGSGILALAALRLGAAHATAVDTDPVAVAAAIANAEANGLADRLVVRQGSINATEAPERFPLVIANLVAALLVDLAPALAAHLDEGGRLVAGGIITGRLAEVEDAFAAAGLAVVERRDDGEWVTLLARRDA